MKSKSDPKVSSINTDKLRTPSFKQIPFTCVTTREVLIPEEDEQYDTKIQEKFRTKINYLATREVINKRDQVDLKTQIDQMEKELEFQNHELENLQDLHSQDAQTIMKNERMLQKLQLKGYDRVKIQQVKDLKSKNQELEEKIIRLQKQMEQQQTEHKVSLNMLLTYIQKHKLDKSDKLIQLLVTQLNIYQERIEAKELSIQEDIDLFQRELEQQEEYRDELKAKIEQYRETLTQDQLKVRELENKSHVHHKIQKVTIKQDTSDEIYWKSQDKANEIMNKLNFKLGSFEQEMNEQLSQKPKKAKKVETKIIDLF